MKKLTKAKIEFILQSIAFEVAWTSIFIIYLIK